MRILFVVPEQPRTTGNWITALRHQQGLVSLGQEVCLAEAAEDSTRLEAVAAEFTPDLVHLLHAYRAGKPWLACRQSATIPLVVSLAGTDLNHGLESAEQGPTIQAVLHRTQALILQNRLALRSFSAAHSALADRLYHVVPAVTLGDAPYPLRQRHDIADSCTIFLHPAGIRPVKAKLELLQLFDSVVTQEPDCMLLFCGPLLDQSYGREFLAALQERPWARYLGAIPAAAMADVLRAADVVLNHSLSEGLPNALLEAACLRRPILARNIPGNRAAFVPERNGLVYASEADFVCQALALAQNPALRRRLSAPNREIPSPRQEALQLLHIYRSLTDCGKAGRIVNSSSSLL